MNPARKTQLLETLTDVYRKRSHPMPEAFALDVVNALAQGYGNTQSPAMREACERLGVLNTRESINAWLSGEAKAQEAEILDKPKQAIPCVLSQSDPESIPTPTQAPQNPANASESGPDNGLPELEHAIKNAEAALAGVRPDWGFPANLRHLRDKSGVSVAWLAGQLGVSPRTIVYWEAGNRLPPTEEKAITQERVLTILANQINQPKL